MKNNGYTYPAGIDPCEKINRRVTKRGKPTGERREVPRYMHEPDGVLFDTETGRRILPLTNGTEKPYGEKLPFLQPITRMVVHSVGSTPGS